MSMPEFGPVQLLVIGFPTDGLKGEILPELQRLREADVVRLIDLLVVAKAEDGEMVVVQTSDLSDDEATAFGAIVGALVGLGAGGEDEAAIGAIAGASELEDGHVFNEDEVWYLADVIPDGTTAAVALIEHRWAIPLRDKIVDAGGVALVDTWVHPADLVAIGAAASATA
jgi:uncharacterized membrane protein